MSNESKGGVANNADIVKAAMSKATIHGTMAGLKQTDVSTILASMKPQIAQALPKHLTAERMCQMTTTLITQNQEIAKCSVASIVGAVMQASILGFEPVSALGQCYFVPYGGHVQFQIGYKGYLRLAQNSKEVKNIYAEVVRKGDKFEYELGLEPKLKHVPNLDGFGDITHVYAVAHLNNGGYQFVVLTHKQIESLRLRSPMQKSGLKGAWATDWEAMAKGKVIKQLAKYLPLSVDVQKAIVTDEAIITDKAFTNTGDGINVDAVLFDPFEDMTNKPVSSTPPTTTDQPEPVKTPPKSSIIDRRTISKYAPPKISYPAPKPVETPVNEPKDLPADFYEAKDYKPDSIPPNKAVEMTEINLFSEDEPIIGKKVRRGGK